MHRGAAAAYLSASLARGGENNVTTSTKAKTNTLILSYRRGDLATNSRIVLAWRMVQRASYLRREWTLSKSSQNTGTRATITDWYRYAGPPSKMTKSPCFVSPE